MRRSSRLSLRHRGRVIFWMAPWCLHFMNDRTGERPVAAQSPGAQARPDITGAYQRGDMLALEMGLSAAMRLTPDRLAQFKSNIEDLAARNPSRYVREWKRAIEEGADAVRDALPRSWLERLRDEPLQSRFGNVVYPACSA